MSGLTSRLDRLWRMAMTGFCFALFGLGGLLLSLVWFNLLLLVQRDRAKRRQLARRSISASFRLFLAVVRGWGYWITASTTSTCCARSTAVW